MDEREQRWEWDDERERNASGRGRAVCSAEVEAHWGLEDQPGATCLAQRARERDGRWGGEVSRDQLRQGRAGLWKDFGFYCERDAGHCGLYLFWLYLYTFFWSVLEQRNDIPYLVSSRTAQ